MPGGHAELSDCLAYIRVRHSQLRALSTQTGIALAIFSSSHLHDE